MDGQAWDDQSLANVDQALATVPPRVRAQLGNPSLGPIHILVNRDGRMLSGRQPYGGEANFFATNDGRNELVLYPDQSVPTIVHELGHSYNLRRIPAGRYALVLLDPEMESFMAAVGWHVLASADQVQAAVDHTQVPMSYDGTFVWPKLSRNDPLEDFANSFSAYYCDRANLQQESPERFAWFDSHLGH